MVVHSWVHWCVQLIHSLYSYGDGTATAESFMRRGDGVPYVEIKSLGIPMGSFYPQKELLRDLPTRIGGLDAEWPNANRMALHTFYRT